MRVYTLLVLRSLMFVDGVMLLAVGSLIVWFMSKPAGFLFGAGCWLLAGMLFGGVRYADHLYDRRP